ncbi:MAG: hypothetical protein VW378_04040 [bacterium]
MTQEKKPFYYQKLTQSAYRSNMGPETSQTHLICDVSLPEFSEEIRHHLKERIAVEVVQFVSLLLPLELSDRFAKLLYLKLLYSDLKV